MRTRWGRSVDPARPLPEYPRPQLVRRDWVDLNGPWDVAFTTQPTPPTSYDARIVVPFSPETELSGVGRQLQPDEWLWYRRSIRPPVPPRGGRVLLHFGAVDQSCTVWLDGVEVGSHVGGYLPFTIDVTDAVAAGPTSNGHETELVVRVRDLSETGWHTRGKQRLARGRIWYTAQSGIWQTVWLEPVPASYVERLTLTPHLADREVEVVVHGDGSGTAVVELAGTTTEVPLNVPTLLPVPHPRPWSPDDPHLYDVAVSLGEGEQQDRVTSYVAMRDLGVGRDARGRKRLLLNGSPVAHVGVLDQGYWPESLLTPPSDEAMVHDLERVKELGFTAVRKHAKVEPLRWYHHCDRLGLLVWQDVVNGGGRYRGLTTTRPARRELPIPDRLHRLFGRADAEGRAEFRDEVRATVELLRNSPCVVVWTPFNEGWGQFDANAIAREVKALDPTRQVHHASGWVDQGGGEIRSFHRYLRPFRMPRWHRGRRRRVVALTEYGGHSLRVEGHDWSDREFGYLHHDDADAFAAAFEEVHEPLVAAAHDGLSATFWTQLTDVEDELNGLLTWDRDVLKLPADVVRRVTAKLRAAMMGA